MLRPPPTSTLFPYTTLFRSGVVPDRHQSSLPDLPGKSAELLFHGGDRKSTRLNSSHLGISYAVFCLKKKTTNQLKMLMPKSCTSASMYIDMKRSLFDSSNLS